MELVLVYVLFAFFVALPATALWGAVVGARIVVHGLRTKDWRVRLGRRELLPLAVGVGLVFAGVALIAAYGKELVVR